MADVQVGDAKQTISKRVKERKHYTEDCLQDEEIEGRRMFSVEEKLTCDGFESCFVDEMKGEDFNLKYLQEHGFVKPVLFKDKAGLGMRMPSANFTVNDVRQCV
ncbi:Lysine-specific demethylase 2A, partial [Stegodyphus mimosarum]